MAKSINKQLNFEEIEKLQHQNRWREAGNILKNAGIALERGGADFIILCTNTMHKLLPEIQESIKIPFLHNC